MLCFELWFFGLPLSLFSVPHPILMHALRNPDRIYKTRTERTNPTYEMHLDFTKMWSTKQPMFLFICCCHPKTKKLATLCLIPMQYGMKFASAMKLFLHFRIILESFSGFSWKASQDFLGKLLRNFLECFSGFSLNVSQDFP